MKNMNFLQILSSSLMYLMFFLSNSVYALRNGPRSIRMPGE